MLVRAVHEALERSATLAEAWEQMRAALPEVPEAVLRELVTGALGGDDIADPPAAGTLRAKFWGELTG